MKDFYKDLRQFVKEYGDKPIEYYERGLITLWDALQLLHAREVEALQDQKGENA